MTLLFHGPPGSGKDTQADLLVSQYNFESIGTGEMFRQMYLEGDPDAVVAHEYWSKGLWVPNNLTYKMLNRWVERYDNTKDWIFVSVVRDKGQIAMFDELLESKGRNLDYFLYFKLKEEMAVERLSLRKYCTNCDTTYHSKYKKESKEGYCDKCGTLLSQREDDKPEKILERFKEDARTSIPIIEEYKGRRILLEIDAAPSIDEIHKEVVKILNL